MRKLMLVTVGLTLVLLLLAGPASAQAMDRRPDRPGEPPSGPRGGSDDERERYGQGGYVVGPGGLFGRRVTPAPDRELEERILLFLNEFAPDRLEELAELKEANYMAYVRELHEVERLMREVEEVRRNDPEMFELIREEGKLRRRIMRLAREYRELHDRPLAPDREEAQDIAGKRKEIREEIGGLVSKLFDVKVRMRKREIERLREELARHEEALAKAQDRKDELVGRRIGLLLGEEEDIFDW